MRRLKYIAFSRPSTGTARLQVLLIPGNPGSAQYFHTQLQLLHQAMKGRVDVMAISHAGHDPLLTEENGGKVRHQSEALIIVIYAYSLYSCAIFMDSHPR